MSRSFRHSPYVPVAADSEKQDKHHWHHRWRTRVRCAMAAGREVPLVHEASDSWAMGKAGKWRFNPRQHPELMRR